MSRKIRPLLRILGVALAIVAGFLFLAGAASSMQSEEHQTADGFVIQHRIGVPHTAIGLGVAGAILFAISFIRTRNGR